MKNDLRSSLLRISLNDPEIASPTFKQFMQEIVEMCLAEKKRRKLPKQTVNEAMPLEENVIEVARESSSACNTERYAEPSTNSYLTVINLPSEETGDSDSDEEWGG